jgi:methylenetetrahydrofolate dehydrogenase (NADP+)/methenyltetrahydrofolate cyclohydrolase
MTAELIRGTAVAEQIRAELAAEAAQLRERRGVVPGLVTILVGEDPASQSYVAAKSRTAKELGFHSVQETRPADLPEPELLALVERCNADPALHGILVQLPLPKQIDEQRVLYAIRPDKDVDAFHPVNVGKLMLGRPDFLPCTPAGIQELLVRSGTNLDGAEVVVVGRSNIVGKPIAMLLAQKGPGANATVTLCHTRTRDLAAHTRRADVLIVAAGRPKAITAEMVKPGAVVIDVGVNRVGVTDSGKAKLCGDVDFEAVREVAAKLTPVPGGVGPMTITMLMRNTLRAAQRSAGG